jgi:hypothetical protein
VLIPVPVGEYAYPASIWVEEPPPNTIKSDSIHSPTPVQKYSEHTLSQVNDLLILFRACRFRSIVGHRVLLWDGRNDERRVQSSQGIAESSELRVSTPDFKVL